VIEYFATTIIPAHAQVSHFTPTKNQSTEAQWVSKGKHLYWTSDIFTNPSAHLRLTTTELHEK